MHAELFPQLLLNGLAIGLIYVLVASGLIILLGVVRIFNFAHAEFYMLGAFITFGMCEILHLNFFLSIAITIAIVIVLGSFSYQFIFRRLRGDILLCTGASIGLSMILMRGALLGFGTQERGLHPPYPGNFRIGSMSLPTEKVIAVVLCIAVMFGLYFLLMRTKIGKAMRAVKLDTEVAALQGINTNKIYLIAFATACALAGLAGGIVAPVYSVTPAMGQGIFLKSLMVLTVGGMQSMAGAVIGGVVVGLITSFGMFYVGEFTEVLIFGVIFIILAFKPFGIFGVPH